MENFSTLNRLTALFPVILILVLTEGKICAAKCPCDIYDAAGTPCVAAHSTVRALYATYNGPLYQVRRTPDTANKKDIDP